jgi:holo-[acyl-carrier protein] synthase
VVIPELGPSLGRLTEPPADAADGTGLRLDDIRLRLVTGVFDLAGAARGFAAAGDAQGARSSLGRVAWLALWEKALASAAERIAGLVNAGLESAAEESRFPRGRLEPLRLRAEDTRAIAARLGRGGAPFVAALDTLEQAGRGSGANGDAETAWRHALNAAARRLEAAWLALEAAAGSSSLAPLASHRPGGRRRRLRRARARGLYPGAAGAGRAGRLVVVEMVNPIGVGIDLVDLARVASMLADKGDHAFARLFTDEERAYLASRPDPTGHAAARIAAKEAVYKALQSLPGARAVGWRDIEVTRDAEGRPAIRLHGLAERLAAEAGGLTIQISLTHSSVEAGAVAVITGPGAQGRGGAG